MKRFTEHTGVVAPLDAQHVDTDQIIPKQFLKRIERTGYQDMLFFDWRYVSDGLTPNPDFEMNEPRYRGASILLTRDNFGCGSSREHAPWALNDYGFRVLIAPSFADIFYTNCFNNGMLPITLPAPIVARLFGELRATQGYALAIDLQAQTVVTPSGETIRFELDAFLKQRLLNGWDHIELTLLHEDKISEFEKSRG
jgi:3-isopropylmalate/(R)-2-methylmalate dehydratase small subunit